MNSRVTIMFLFLLVVLSGFRMMTKSVFVESLLPLPYNLPDFPAPEEQTTFIKSKRKLIDTVRHSNMFPSISIYGFLYLLLHESIVDSFFRIFFVRHLKSVVRCLTFRKIVLCSISVIKWRWLLQRWFFLWILSPQRRKGSTKRQMTSPILLVPTTAKSEAN